MRTSSKGASENLTRFFSGLASHDRRCTSTSSLCDATMGFHGRPRTLLETAILQAKPGPVGAAPYLIAGCSKLSYFLLLHRIFPENFQRLLSTFKINSNPVGSPTNSLVFQTSRLFLTLETGVVGEAVSRRCRGSLFIRSKKAVVDSALFVSGLLVVLKMPQYYWCLSLDNSRALFTSSHRRTNRYEGLRMRLRRCRSAL